MPPNYDDDSPVYTGHPVRRDHPDDYYSSGAGTGPAAGFGVPDRPFHSDEETFVREEMTVLPPSSPLPYHESRIDALAYPDRAESPSPSPWRPPGDRSRSRSDSSSSDGSQNGQQQQRRRRQRRRSDASSSPVSRARHVVEDNFTNSSAGIGASILGAVVGGFVASRASDAAFAHDRSAGGRNRRQRRRRHGTGEYDDGGDEDDDYDSEGDGDDDEGEEDEQRRAMARGVSALIGAVAGGLGANVFAHHVEGEREKRRSRESAHRNRNIDGEYKRHSQRHDDYDHGHDIRQRDDSHHRKS